MTWRVDVASQYRLPSGIKHEYDESEYILDLKFFCHGDALLASASDLGLHILDAKSHLAPITSIKAHDDRISSIHCSCISPALFYSASVDKTVKLWDARSSSHLVASIRFDEEVQAMTANHSDTLIVAANGNVAEFYDIRKIVSSGYRKSCKLGVYGDIHSDEITQLMFAPNQHNILLSGGADGLICLYNTSASEMEDAVISILNTDCDIGKVGFFGPSLEGIYCISTIETLSLWHYPSAQRISNFSNIREDLNVDYLVDCFSSDENSALILVAGSHTGTFKLVAVEPNQFMQLYTDLHAHTATLRAVTIGRPSNGSSGELPFDSLFTCAEDAQVIHWKVFPTEGSNLNSSSQFERVVSGGQFITQNSPRGNPHIENSNGRINTNRVGSLSILKSKGLPKQRGIRHNPY